MSGGRVASGASKRALVALLAITRREFLRFIHNRPRFLAAIIRPLLWLLVFAAGFRAALGLSIIPPYQSYITYETYITPGLCGMILLFGSMQSALSLVYDREMGSMRLLLTSPLPRWWLLFSRIFANSLIVVLQAGFFLAIASLMELGMPLRGYVFGPLAMFVAALGLGALGLLISATIRQLENFAGVMNFVIFPMFFLSSALYPIWRMAEASALLARICALNPFSHSVEFIRFALYGQMHWGNAALVAAEAALFFALAQALYSPARGLRAR